MIAVGTKLSEMSPRLVWLDFKLSDTGLAVGDLVMYSPRNGDNDTILYRITKDQPPDGNLVWSDLTSKRGNDKSKPQFGWARSGQSIREPDFKVLGHVVIEPAIVLFNGVSATKKVILYRKLHRLRKIDILELAQSFSIFQDFVQREAKRLTKL